VTRRCKAGGHRDIGHRVAGVPEPPGRFVEPHAHDILPGREAKGLLESAGKAADVHAHEPRQCFKAVAGIDLSADRVGQQDAVGC